MSKLQMSGGLKSKTERNKKQTNKNSELQMYSIIFWLQLMKYKLLNFSFIGTKFLNECYHSRG